MTHQKLMMPTTLAFVTVALSFCTYFWFVGQVTRPVLARYDFSEQVFAQYETKVRKEWRPRIGSTLLVRAFHTTDVPVMRKRIAIYVAAWFFALALVYIAIDARGAIFLMLGTFATLVYDGSSAADNTWVPWDMPALFFSALALYAALKRKLWLLVITLMVGLLFKETVLVMAVLLLGFEGDSRFRRLVQVGAILLCGYALRLSVERYVGTPLGPNAFSYRLSDDPTRETRAWLNLKFLFSVRENHLSWVNIGLFFLVFFLPTRDSVLRAAKLALGLLYLGLFFAGNYTELRIFLEALPASLVLLHAFLERPNGGGVVTRALPT